MFSRGNPFVCTQEETSSTRGASHLRAGLSLSWPSHIHIQPNLLKSCHLLCAALGFVDSSRIQPTPTQSASSHVMLQRLKKLPLRLVLLLHLGSVVVAVVVVVVVVVVVTAGEGK